jgi:glycosyltransferase involved in cell wall biosynthesis
VSVSAGLDRYLSDKVGVAASRRSLIANGLDTDLFRPRLAAEAEPQGWPFSAEDHWLVGTVGRLQTVKNQPLLARAFVHLLQRHPEVRPRARLVIVGEGPLRLEVERILSDAGLLGHAWLPGARSDIPSVLRRLDCFVLPSETEGTSCTLQEAMACGLPCVATAVGGTPDLLRQGRTGSLVPPGDAVAMAEAIYRCMAHPDEARAQGVSARAQAVDSFGVQAMIGRYDELFSTL